MATVYVDAALGDDARSYAQAQSSATPWKTPLRVNAAATAGDTAILADGTYLSTDYTGAPNHHAFTRLMTYIAATARLAILTATSSNYVARISTSMPAGTFSLRDIVIDGQTLAIALFQIGQIDTLDYVLNTQNVAWQRIRNYGINVLCRRGSVVSANDFFEAVAPFGGTVAGILSANNDLGAVSGAPFSATIVNARMIIAAPSDAQVSKCIGLASSTSRLSACTYKVFGGDYTLTSHPSASSRAIELLGGDNAQVIGTKITLRSTGAPECNGIFVAGRSASGTANNPEVKNNYVDFDAPAGHAITLGESTSATNNMSGGELSGNKVRGRYFPANTPHGITAGRDTSLAQRAGDEASDLYIGHLASRCTSGTAISLKSFDSYGADFYAKGCTAYTFKDCLAVQSGKFPRRNLAPFSIDSQGGVSAVATTMDAGVVVIAESDFSRVGALANITINQNGTFQDQIYFVPDTWDTNTTDRFFVGGSEGGRSGATGYTIDEWVSGTAGSVIGANGTGTISVSGVVVNRLPIAQLKAMAAALSPSGGASSGSLVYTPGKGVGVVV